MGVKLGGVWGVYAVVVVCRDMVFWCVVFMGVCGGSDGYMMLGMYGRLIRRMDVGRADCQVFVVVCVCMIFTLAWVWVGVYVSRVDFGCVDCLFFVVCAHEPHALVWV